VHQQMPFIPRSDPTSQLSCSVVMFAYVCVSAGHVMMAEIRIGIVIGTETESLGTSETTRIRSGDAVQAEKGLVRQPEME
jgi:hypothetical protein